MHAGLFEGRPRSRELVYVMLGQRAARALGDLHMHDNTWTLEQASEFASKATPRGWLRLDGRTVRGEQLLVAAPAQLRDDLHRRQGDDPTSSSPGCPGTARSR